MWYSNPETMTSSSKGGLVTVALIVLRFMNTVLESQLHRKKTLLKLGMPLCDGGVGRIRSFKASLHTNWLTELYDTLSQIDDR